MKKIKKFQNGVNVLYNVMIYALLVLLVIDSIVTHSQLTRVTNLAMFLLLSVIVKLDLIIDKLK